MEHNRICAQYCIDIIRAVMQEQEIPSMPEGVSLGELYEFSQMHTLEALVFNGISQLDLNKTDPVLLHWCNRAQMILNQSIVQLAERDNLFAVLNENGMELLPVKGSWLKEDYPQIDFRQMADLDILIRKEDREKARKIMLALGYEEDFEEAETYHDSYKKKPYMAVELHSRLLSDKNPNSVYYETVWEKAGMVDGNPRLRRLPAEDEYIYFFLHTKKHMEEAGIGIRYLLDCFVYRNINPDWDREYLNREFQKLGIQNYVQQMEQLADCWFSTSDPVPQALSQLEEHVLWTGTYGSLDNLLQNHMDTMKRKYKNPVFFQIAYWSSRVFRPLEEMKCHYRILEDLPILLPVFWVIRIIGKCIEKPGAILYHVKKIFNEGKNHD